MLRHPALCAFMSARSPDPLPDNEYVLGTHDAEIARLEVQHNAWRDDAGAAWRTAGFTRNHAIVDVGCGPGFATLDLAALVGPEGRIVAIDQSRRFLAHLRRECERRGYGHVHSVETDLTRLSLPRESFDGAWIRWVLAFVASPRDVLARLADALKPDGAVAIHEYFEYGTWRLWPRDADFERFVAATMAAWRHSGGEPDVGLAIPTWLEELGFAVRSVRLITDLVKPPHPRWEWAMAFASSGPLRLAELGDISQDDAARMLQSVNRARAAGAWMITPGVAEIVAVKVATPHRPP
jgi:SAM-dependent methyltransferase